VTEIRDSDLAVADDGAQLAHFLMRACEKGFEQAQLVHDLQRRGMDRVAAEVAQENRGAFRARAPRPRRAPTESRA
jgi:hypothetical protein